MNGLQFLLPFFLCSLISLAQSNWPLPAAPPIKAGFSPERLDQLHHYTQSLVSQGKYSGITVLLARDGHILDWHSVGHRDPLQAIPLRTNPTFDTGAMREAAVAEILGKTISEVARSSLQIRNLDLAVFA